MTILERLRAETAPHHKQIEDDLNVFSQINSLPSYQKLLAGFAAFYAPIEAHFQESEFLKDVAIDQRLKSQWLKNDLAHLETLTSSRVQLPKPSQAEQPDLSSIPKILGTLYVIEGSTLGSQVIVKALTEKLGLAPEVSTFYRGYGPETGVMWQRFRSFLTQYSENNPSHDDEIVAAAAEMFTKLGRWFRTHA